MTIFVRTSNKTKTFCMYYYALWQKREENSEIMTLRVDNKALSWTNNIFYATTQFLRCVEINSLSAESKQNPQYWAEKLAIYFVARKLHFNCKKTIPTAKKNKFEQFFQLSGTWKTSQISRVFQMPIFLKIFAARSFSHWFYLVLQENTKKVEKSYYLRVPWSLCSFTT